jgi:hypothetical protein
MWGEGYDYPPQYTAMSGDIVGALPVGIQSHRNADAPYWPTENCHNWKEVWVHPVGRWIWLMRDLAGPAEVQGTTRLPVQFRELSTGRISRAVPNPKTGQFHAVLSEGEYELTSGTQKRALTLLPGETASVVLDGARDLDFRVKPVTTAAGVVTIRIEVSGSGDHVIALRTDNLSSDALSWKVTLKPGTPQIVEWQTDRERPDSPWIAVVIPDNDVALRREITAR